jgi:hypothetical protein
MVPRRSVIGRRVDLPVLPYLPFELTTLRHLPVFLPCPCTIEYVTPTRYSGEDGSRRDISPVVEDNTPDAAATVAVVTPFSLAPAKAPPAKSVEQVWSNPS